MTRSQLPAQSTIASRQPLTKTPNQSSLASVKVEQSGIDAVADDAADLFIRGEGSNLVIDATADAIYPVYTLDGRFVRNVEVTVGHNVYSDLAAGFYLVNKNKVVIR